MELRSRPSAGNDYPNRDFPNYFQRLHGSRHGGGAAVYDKERQDRSSGHAQGIGAKENPLKRSLQREGYKYGPKTRSRVVGMGGILLTVVLYCGRAPE